MKKNQLKRKQNIILDSEMNMVKIDLSKLKGYQIAAITLLLFSSAIIFYQIITLTTTYASIISTTIAIIIIILGHIWENRKK